MRISDWSSDVCSSDLIAACKGLEPKSGKLVHEVIEEVLGHRHPFGVLSGPTFAKELGIGLPTAVTIASADESFAEKFATLLHCDGFRAVWCAELPDVESGGPSTHAIGKAACRDRLGKSV